MAALVLFVMLLGGCGAKQQADPAATAVKTFDNGIATINTETCKALGLDYDEIAAIFSPFCTKVQPITTAESF